MDPHFTGCRDINIGNFLYNKPGAQFFCNQLFILPQQFDHARSDGSESDKTDRDFFHYMHLKLFYNFI